MVFFPIISAQQHGIFKNFKDAILLRQNIRTTKHVLIVFFNTYYVPHFTLLSAPIFWSACWGPSWFHWHTLSYLFSAYWSGNKKLGKLGLSQNIKTGHYCAVLTCFLARSLTSTVLPRLLRMSWWSATSRTITTTSVIPYWISAPANQFKLVLVTSYLSQETLMILSHN